MAAGEGGEGTGEERQSFLAPFGRVQSEPRPWELGRRFNSAGRLSRIRLVDETARFTSLALLATLSRRFEEAASRDRSGGGCGSPPGAPPGPPAPVVRAEAETTSNRCNSERATNRRGMTTSSEDASSRSGEALASHRGSSWFVPRPLSTQRELSRERYFKPSGFAWWYANRGKWPNARRGKRCRPSARSAPASLDFLKQAAKDARRSCRMAWPLGFGSGVSCRCRDAHRGPRPREAAPGRSRLGGAAAADGPAASMQCDAVISGATTGGAGREVRQRTRGCATIRHRALHRLVRVQTGTIGAQERRGARRRSWATTA